jgi:amidohydrolase
MAADIEKAGALERYAEVERACIELSHRIHATPELAFEEEQSAGWIAHELADAGFDVEFGICDLPTAFAARAGSGPLHVAFCAEYDALPAIGHACGHNIIAASSVGAAIAAAKVADEVGLTVTLLGTPGEEVCDAGGKVLMLERGAFDGVHAAMMAHPAPIDIVPAYTAACSRFEVEYRGREAHAGAFPERGINAADALTVAQTSLGLLRQHIKTDERIHGIITKGGDVANVVPAHTCCQYVIRSRTLTELEALRTRVLRCFEAGAIATGSSMEVMGGQKPYAEMNPHADLGALYRANAEARGRRFLNLGAMAEKPMGSTDMGNVSQHLPAIHPMIGIDSLPASNHQPEFTAHCNTEAADRAVSDAAVALAWTAIDLASDASLRERLVNGTAM